MEKTFILGMGCQKGGTSWLYHYLNTNPVIDMGFMKEYHVFDALYVNECKRFLDNALQQLKLGVDAGDIDSLHPNILKLTGFYRDPENYFEYFDCLHHKSKKIRVVGDITPSYSALPINALEHIRRGLETRNFNIKVIFLLRDPFDRVWSHARMIRKRKLKNNPGHQFKMSEEEELLSLFDTASFQIRTRYEETIKNIESVFDADDVYYEFYENLFKEESIKKIADFLSIPYQIPNFKEKINASPTSEAIIKDSVICDVVNHYKDTYLFSIEKFGQQKINKLWPNSKYLKPSL